ncbi:hypothetical protein GCM10010156_76680 [Planobispora rosea]|nr:hypothetical protein GCM10010156_76680 [Planobispora rosea]
MQKSCRAREVLNPLPARGSSRCHLAATSDVYAVNTTDPRVATTTVYAVNTPSGSRTAALRGSPSVYAVNTPRTRGGTVPVYGVNSGVVSKPHPRGPGRREAMT